MRKILLTTLFILIGIQFLFGGLIEAKALAKAVKSEDIIIVSARSASDYSSKHIKDAVNLYHQDLYEADGVPSMLKSPEEISVILGSRGITTDSKVVVYDDGANKAAGRIYWILQYMGVKDVNILNGHIKSWMKSRLPVTGKATEITPVSFVPNINDEVYASMSYVQANKDRADLVLVDVRSLDEFNGIDTDANISRKGHIPGALHIEYKNVLNEDETLKSKDEIMAALSAAGISGDKEIILYCASSVRAGIVYMALKSVLEFPRVRVYDGAYYEWQSVDANPVE
ncbi:MAG: sulfurtransferase [Candidatus Stygibacter australis]|nr:sulfurtransferase [Candidatus Stygibacter australis]MDP8323490.1 sulfurtransferase [Candidatus Stygibacter australis]